jgi:pyruvoyl-dependent arginine decarboxylase (PvlArgDC)
VATIYKVHYDNVPVDVEPGLMKANIGSSLSEDRNYWGSMSERGEARMREDHARGVAHRAAARDPVARSRRRHHCCRASTR